MATDGFTHTLYIAGREPSAHAYLKLYGEACARGMRHAPGKEVRRSNYSVSGHWQQAGVMF